MPQSEIFYKPHLAMCVDDVVRVVHVRCYRFDGSMAHDTFTAAPAYTYAKGKTVRGFVTNRVHEDLTVGVPSLSFVAYQHLKNGAVIKKAY